MSIIQQLQDDIVNPEVSLAAILRRAKILAYRLRHDELKKWVDNELNGYPGEDSIPRYRRYQTHSYGDFFGSLGTHVTNAPIPTISLPDSLKGFAKEISMDGGVGSLEGMMHSPDIRKYGAIKFAWPPDAIAFAAQTTIYKDMNLVSAWKWLGSNHITQILETVRNRLLRFVLELQDSFPELTESDDKIREIPQERTTVIFNTHVHGNQNVVAAGTNITQDVRQVVRSNDIGSLLSYLKSVGVSEEDAQELKEAVEEDGPREKAAGFGPRVRDWLAKKAPEWVLNAATVNTVTIAFKALEQHYGWLT